MEARCVLGVAVARGSGCSGLESSSATDVALGLEWIGLLTRGSVPVQIPQGDR